ncbi:ATP synthase epsilon chain [bacterium BMS3Abin05]|nr:ATP synthase epsilon chain [bacterium BMS3Abin05]GBE26325.1 ATP synthase epsilon chain [bacterium BMS3Bbin03]HDL78574.1 F0F1 ATP synthase subunit epsilon [Bacteroidota bacterium]HDZ13114.1 F0F1 ATP synthase subunit epsilon [Bacteroidota bacterium]
MSEDDKSFMLEILTPDRVIFSGEIIYLRAPGIEGSFGVLKNHIPFLTALDIGEIEVETSDQKYFFAAGGGFAEVLNNVVSILAETAERADEIDVERAKKARERAEARLRARTEGVNANRARAALVRAMTRLKIASKI